MIKYTKDSDHIATLTLEMEGRTNNILNHEIVAAFAPVLAHLIAEKKKGKLRGVILTSAKKTFLTGGDVEYLFGADDPAVIFGFSEKLKAFFRDMERPGVPIVAAMNGSAFGMGMEFALATHHRILLAQPQVRVGLPEINFGIMPGNGGVIRLMWLMGIEKTFDILTAGKEFSPKLALDNGLVDELADNEDDLLQKAKKWLLDNPEGIQPWDKAKAQIPGGSAKTPATAQLLARLAARVGAAWQGNFPAPQAILNTLAEGSQVDFDTACRIESRFYTSLLRSKEAKNMMQALWFDAAAIAGGISRPKGFGRFRPQKVGIIGAGFMGSGIATACLLNGMKVVVKDVSRMVAEQGRERIERMLDAAIAEGQLPENERVACLGRIATTESAADFADCDLVIESVFENANLKKKVTKETEEYLDEFAFIASNTISIPITELAENSRSPEHFVGLHFFAPVVASSLVEIVRGKKTGDETIAKAFDFVRAIQKTPIVVKDDWGFYVARVQNTYILEGITMLQEGIPPAVIENAGRQAGMGRGALAFADELSLPLVLRYEQQAAGHYGNKYVQHPAVAVLNAMLSELQRPGATKGRGFYDYGAEGGPSLWPALQGHFSEEKKAASMREIMERLLFAQVLEAAWCMQEKVITSVPEANLGSVFGWGFPAFKGGVLQYVADYGQAAFLARCKELEQAHGQRFQAPKWLRGKGY